MLDRTWQTGGAEVNWQPIETAPSDRWLLVYAYYPRFARKHAGQWHEQNAGRMGEDPTHWAPLPDEP
jgi:hypothetical protein